MEVEVDTVVLRLVVVVSTVVASVEVESAVEVVTVVSEVVLRRRRQGISHITSQMKLQSTYEVVVSFSVRVELKRGGEG